MIKGSIWNKDLENLFYTQFKKDIYSCDVLSSHGSDRIIIRIKSPDKSTAIGIINKHIEENRAFLEFSKHFLNHGINVPKIYGVSDDLTCYLIEDLGDLTLYDYRKKTSKASKKNSFGKDVLDLYKKTILELQKFQIEAGPSVNYKLCYQFKEFGTKNIVFDLNYFKQRFLKYFYPNHPDKLKFEKDLNSLRTKLLEVPRNYFLYRDFQSRNIMLKRKKLYFIDFQSGRKGALQYDLASLLFDAKADIPQSKRELLLDFYINRAHKIYNLDTKNFKEYFWYFAIIRILQAMGAYGYLGITKGKKKFLESVPYAIKNINMLLREKISKNSLIYLRKIFDELTEQNSKYL